MKEIELTQGFVASIDDEDYDRLMKINKFWTGVYYFVPKKGLKHWHAQITRHGVQRSLGKFLTKEEAVAARLEAENAIAQAEAE